MSTIADLVTIFQLERPVGNLLDVPDLTAQALSATRFYQGYGALEEHLAIPIAEPAPITPVPYPLITDLTVLSVSEWAIIKPLFLYYVECENALQLEAGRGMGIDVYGRSVAEIIGDINQYEADMHHKAFSCPVVSVM
jgi:hypothetical protein